MMLYTKYESSGHWLTPNNLYFLNSILSEFDYFGKCDNSNRSKGGVAIMWNKRLSHRIVPIDVIKMTVLWVFRCKYHLQSICLFFKFIFLVSTIAMKYLLNM